MSESAHRSGKIVRLPTGVSVFGPFHFERRTGRLSRSDAEIHLTPRAANVLRCLIAHPGEVVSKDELFAQVWKDVNVTDDALLQVVSALRKALGDDPRRPEYIQTVTGEGYRFIAEVSEAGVEDAPAPGLAGVPGPVAELPGLGTRQAAAPEETTVSHAGDGKPWSRRRIVAGLALTVVAATLLGWALLNANNWRWPGSPERRSIAVLPFTNLSGDPEQDYFSDGLAEELVGVLSAIDGLRVAARTSSFVFKGQNRDVREIAQQLDVGHVLEGSARRQGDRVRITTRLIDASSGFELWSEIYDREQSDLFAIQQDIATRVADALTIPLMGERASRVAQPPTDNLDAYEAYLQGRYFLARYTADAFRAAARSFQRAIDIDPDFAAAHVGLADAYLLQNRYGSMPLGEALTLAEPAIERALQLDARIAEAHAMRGLALQRQGDIDGAKAAYERALDLDPDSARTYQLYWWTMFLQEGNTDFTLELVAHALRADPLSPVQNENFGWSLFEAGRFDEALAYFEKSIELEPSFSFGYMALGGYWRAKGDLEAAVEAYRKALSLSPENPLLRRNLGNLLAQLGQTDESLELLEQMLAVRADEGGRYGDIGEVYWDALGRADRAVPWYERAVEESPGSARLRALFALVWLDLDDEEQAARWVAAANDIDPDNRWTQIGRLNLAMYRRDYTDNAPFARRIAADMPYWGYLGQLDRPYEEYTPLGYFNLLAQRASEALIFPQRVYPRLLDDDPVIDVFNINAAIDLAAILLQTGDDGRAELLLERSQEFIASQSEDVRRTRYREEPAEIYALQGRVPEALAALRAAIDDGWRRGWWRAREKPHYTLLRQEPEFQAMLDELADEARSRRLGLAQSASR